MRSKVSFCAALAVGGLVAGSYGVGLRWNSTPSMPVGLWRFAAVRQVTRGEAVGVCLPEAAARLGVARGYLSGGPCPAGAEEGLKAVAAIPGDQVTVSPAGIAVNGHFYAHTQPLAHDDHGRSLTAMANGTYTVGRHDVWLIGTNDARSYDSRYFGPAPIANIRHHAEPIVVWK